MDIEPADLVNVGVNALTVYLLLRALNRIDALTERIFAYLEAARQERAALLRSQGIEPSEVNRA